METVNQYAMIEQVYPILLKEVKQEAISSSAIQDTIAAVSGGYSFPTNLDFDPPIDSNVLVTAQQMTAGVLPA